MPAKLHPHLPTITPRVEFSSFSRLSPPVITPRVDFAELWTTVAHNDIDSHAVTRDPSPFSDSDDGAMDLDLNVDDEPLFNNKKIPKPSGEPGRPNSGGYSIENELRVWGADKIAEVMKFVKVQAEDHLDTTQSYSKQSSPDVDLICKMASNHFPIVGKYENYWPIRDMLKLHLKYTSEIHRKQDQLQAKPKAKAQGSSRQRTGGKQ